MSLHSRQRQPVRRNHQLQQLLIRDELILVLAFH